MKTAIRDSLSIRILSVFLVLICLLPLVACNTIEDPLASVELSNPAVSSEKTSESGDNSAGTGLVFSTYKRSYTTNIVTLKDHYYQVTDFEFAGQKIESLAKFNVHTGEAVPVCADPLCNHKHGYGSSCPFGEIRTLLAVEDDRYVYFTRGVSRSFQTGLGTTSYESTGMMYFVRYDPVTLTSEKIFEAPAMTVLGMTESYVYFVKRTWIDKEADKPTGEMSVYRYDFQKKEFETLCVYDRYTYLGELASEGHMISPLFCEYEQWLNPLYVDREDRVYFEKYSQVLDGQGGVEERTRLGMYMLDSKKSDAIEEVQSPSPPAGFEGYGVYVISDNEWILMGQRGINETADSFSGRKLYRFDLTTGESTLLADDDFYGIFVEDYYYYWPGSSKVVFKRKGKDIFWASDTLVRISLKTGERKEFTFDMTEMAPCRFKPGSMFYIDGVLMMIDGRCEYADERIRVPSTMYFNLENETWFAVDLPDMSIII